MPHFEFLHRCRRQVAANELPSARVARFGSRQLYNEVRVGLEMPFADVDQARLSVYTKRVFARLGIPDASLHTLRHTAAGWLVMEGVDLDVGKGQILGHKRRRA